MTKKRSSLDWYYENREYQMKKHREWLNKNREGQKEYHKIHNLKRRDKMLIYKKDYRLKNKEKIKEYNQRPKVKEMFRLAQMKYRKNNPDKRREYYEKNRDRIREYEKKHSQIPEVKARRNLMARIRNKKSPRSNRSLPLDLQLIMNQVRLRDKNTCKWHGCGLTHREAPIHVHHIFPQSEYPELAYEEKYMICYCMNHHVMFHRWRGDKYSEMIGKRTYGILQEILD